MSHVFRDTLLVVTQNIFPLLSKALRSRINSCKLATVVEGDSKAPFSIATTLRCRRGRYSFSGLLYFTLDAYLIMLSVKQGGMKYHFWSFWYDSTWDWTQVSQAIKQKKQKNTTLFVVEFLAVTCVLCILRHTIFSFAWLEKIYHWF